MYSLTIAHRPSLIICASCNKSSERARYAPFIRGFNRALELLKEIQQPRGIHAKLRDPSEMDVLFHRNDRQTIKAEYSVGQRNNSALVPDVVLSSTEAARRRFGLSLSSLDTLRHELLQKAPNLPRGTNFNWINALATLEFKCNGPVRSAIPPSYNRTDHVEDIHQIGNVQASTPPKYFPASELARRYVHCYSSNIL